MTKRRAASVVKVPGSDANPSGSTVLVPRSPEYGMLLVIATAVTPGVERTASSSRCTNSRKRAAAVGVAASMLIGFLQRTLDLKGVLIAARQAAESCAMIGLIMIGAMFLSTAIGYLGVPRFIATEIQGWGMSPFMLIVVLLVFYVILGTVMEGLGIIVMTLPITLPLVLAATHIAWGVLGK